MKKILVHRKILIENNTFHVYDTPLLIARSTENMSFIGNTVVQINFGKFAKSSRPAFNLTACRDVKIIQNHFDTSMDYIINLNNMKRKCLTTDVDIIRQQ